MKKEILYLFIFLIIISISHAQEDSLYQSQYLKLNVKYTSGINIVEENKNAQIEKLSINYTFFPKDAQNQDILNIDTIGKISQDSIIFEISEPEIGQNNFDVTSRLITKNDFIRIKEKVQWPIQDIPQDIEIYTKAQEITNTNENIRMLASRLAQGEDDLFVVVNNIAEWTVDNIEYNLSTVTASASKPSSWVIENRYGVCDEITSLFISMVRSLGIPARFVVGTSYTNSPLFSQKWGPHGWAEVYFPGFGWVPYDVTYHQFGYIDATHITNGHYIDSKPIQTSFNWLGRDVRIDADELKTEVRIEEYGPSKSDYLSVDLEPLKGSVDFDSYNLISAKITNNMDYYISTEVYIANTTKINIIDKNKKKVLLSPKQTKNYFWLIRVEKNLNADYLYTFPIVVYTAQRMNATTKFQAIKDGKFVSLEYVNNALKDLLEEETKTLSNQVDVNCYPSKKEYASYETAQIKCLIKNSGNVLLEDLQICLENDCSNTDLSITEVKSYDFTIEKMLAGVNDLKLKVVNDHILKSESIEFFVLDDPDIKISFEQYPQKARYDEQFNATVTIERISKNIPKDIRLDIGLGAIKKTIDIEELANKNSYDFMILGKDLNPGNNEFNISATYHDQNQKEFTESESVKIELIELNIFQKMKIFFRNLTR